MLAKSLLLLASAALSLASPIIANGGASTGISCQSSRSPPVLPKTGGASELPAPAQALKLKYIALGFGIQNYTCASVGATPTATGALAMLYDITNLYPKQGFGSLSQEKWDNLTSYVIRNAKVPLNFDPTLKDRVEPSAPGASATKPFPRDAPLYVKGYWPFPFLGHHIFTKDGVPNFNINDGEINLFAAKDAGVPAPAKADIGPMGTGTVPWLALRSRPESVGARYVYRVSTAGGNSHGCAKRAGQDSTSYTAAYWVYE